MAAPTLRPCLWAALLVGAPFGCAKPPVAGPTPPVLTDADLGGGRCTVRRDRDNPFVVEWDGTDRARLESAIRRGVVAVRYSGCEIELLAACNAGIEYAWEPLTPKSESVEVRDADELYARFPKGAVRLEGTLERAGLLSVDMLTVGRYESPRTNIAREELAGTCQQATHVVTGLTVGAFSFHTGAKAALDASLDITAVGEVGASSSSEREELSTDGDVAACQQASLSDRRPPERCGAIMRIEVAPLPEVGANDALAHVGKGRFDLTAPWGRLYRDGTWMWGLAGVGFGMFVVAPVFDNDGGDAGYLAFATVGGTALLTGLVGGAVLYGIAGKRRRRVLEKAARAGLQARGPHRRAPRFELRGGTLRF